MRVVLRIALPSLATLFGAVATAAEPEEPRYVSAASVASAVSTATVEASAESPLDPEGGVSFGLELGTITSNPWRGDQLAGSNREPYWTALAEFSAPLGPGALGVGFAALGPTHSAYAEFGIPVSYTLEFGAWETAVVYEPMPTTTSRADEVAHEFGADVRVAVGPVAPVASVRADPTIERGVYASGGLEWEHTRGRATVHSSGVFGTTAYAGRSFGAQHIDATLGSSVALGAGVGARIDGVLSYGFRTKTWLPYGSLALTSSR